MQIGGLFITSIPSSSGSELPGLRSIGKLKGHPQTAQYFSLPEITPDAVFALFEVHMHDEDEPHSGFSCSI